MEISTNALKVMLKFLDDNNFRPFLSHIYYSKSYQTVFVSDGSSVLMIKPTNTKFETMSDFEPLNTNNLKSVMAINKNIELDSIETTNIERPTSFIKSILDFTNPEKCENSASLNSYNPNYLMSATKLAKAYKLKFSYPEYIKNGEKIGIWYKKLNESFELYMVVCKLVFSKSYADAE